MNLRTTLSFLALYTALQTQAQLFLPPDGGWDYRYEGDAAASASDAALDGLWDHDNPTDLWSGDVGAVNTNSHGEVTFLHIDDALTTGNDRKIFLTYDLEANNGITTNAFLDDGFTLHAR